MLGQSRIGAPREAVAPGLRVTFCRRYAIYYTHDDAEVVIVRVAHGARDRARLFERANRPDTGTKPRPVKYRPRYPLLLQPPPLGHTPRSLHQLDKLRPIAELVFAHGARRSPDHAVPAIAVLQIGIAPQQLREAGD